MALLPRFSPPGNLTEMSEEGRILWSSRVSDLFDLFPAQFPQFFNPVADEGGPADSETPTEHRVAWPAFPGTLVTPGGSDEVRWNEADSSRDRQDEYCEWGVERNGDGIVRVTFTTETPDYFDHLLKTDEELFRELYEDLVGEEVPVDDLRDANGDLDPKNQLNRPASGKIAHLSERSNNLLAAIALAAEATVLREKDGVQVTEKKALVRCGGLGEELRNSDPQIALAINQLAGEGNDISLADPPGLYIDEFLSAGIQTPDDADAADFWQLTRGDEEHAVRARFEVPTERGYPVSKITIDDQPITTGAQLADRVRVRIAAITLPGEHEPVPQPCVDGGS
jgi:hypothetical protein